MIMRSVADVDGWDVGGTSLGVAGRSVSPLSASPTLRSSGAVRDDPGQAYWRGRIGIGAVKEIGWGLRPQLSVDVARQLNDGRLAPFGKQRGDWLLEGTFSIYKRDWNVEGFAPSLSADFYPESLDALAL